LKSVSLLLLMALLALLPGCKVNLKERRIRLYNEKFEAYSEKSKAYIIKGKVVAGMTRDQVYLAMGVPRIIERGGESPEISEKWIYNCPRDKILVVEFERGKVIKVDEKASTWPADKLSFKP